MTLAKHSFPAGRTEGVVDRAAAIYDRKGLKFTHLRRLVLEAVAERDTPVGAYTILQVLEGRYRKLSPISVYRALDSLMGIGVVRKLKTQNAYFVAECFRTRTKQPADKRLYLICEDCKRVTEATSPGAYQLIEQVSQSALFKIRVNAVEVSGICDACAQKRGRAKGGGPARLGQKSLGRETRAQKI